MSSPLDSDEYRLVPPRKAHCVLLLLFLLMAFDFIDRQVLSALMPAIKAEWHLSDTQLGLLVSAVNIAIALLALPVAVVVDRWSRTRSIGIMAVVWSVATGACALAGNFHHLLIARFVVGTGEAGYGAGGNALLGAMYPTRLRGTVIGIFQSAVMIGPVIGVVLGGYIAAKWGWRHAFGVVAVPGLLLAILMFFVKDYKTVPVQVTDAVGKARELGWAEVLIAILRNPVLVLLFLAESAQLFFVSTLGNWLPSFLNRAHGMPVEQAGLRTGVLLLISGVGIAAGGWLIDRFAGHRLHRRLFGAAVFALLTAGFFIVAFRMPAGPAQRMVMYGGAFFMVAVLGPVMAGVMDLVHPGMRTTALGMMVTFSNLFGMALGPLIGGLLSDRFDLQTALLITAFIPLLAAVGYVVAGMNYERGRIGERSAALAMA